MLSFGARVTSRIIEKPLVGLSKTIFPKTKTAVKKFLNPNLSKGEQIVKRTVFRNNDITSFANVSYIDLTKESGKKVIKAYDKNENVLAEGFDVIKQLMKKGKNYADFWYRHH